VSIAYISFLMLQICLLRDEQARYMLYVPGARQTRSSRNVT
jgi:hypothetical protein